MTTSKVLKNSAIYTVVSVLQKAIGFFLLPLYTIYLTPKDFGITGIVSTFVSLFSIFLVLSLNGAGTYFTYEYINDKKKIAELWGTLFTFIIINAFVFCLIIIFFHKIFRIDNALKGISFHPYILIAVISVFFSSLYQLYQSYLQSLQNGKKYGINNLIFFLTNIFLTIGLVVFFKKGALGVILAFLFTNIIFVGYTFVDFVPKIKLGINSFILKKSLKYSLPLLPHSIFAWIMTLIDRFFINNLQSTASVGIYNVGFQFGLIMNIVTTAVNQAYVPWFFEMLKNGKEGESKIIKFTEIGILFYSVLALLISLFCKEVIGLFLSSSFFSAWKVVSLLCFANVFNGYYYFFVNVLFEKNTKLVPIITFIGAILTIIFNFILVKKYDFFGAAMTNLFVMFILSLVTFFISQKLRKITFPIIKMYCITFFCLFVSMIAYMNISFWILFVLKCIILLVIAYIINCVYRSDIKNIWNTLINYKKLV